MVQLEKWKVPYVLVHAMHLRMGGSGMLRHTSVAKRIGKPSANAVSWPGANSGLTSRDAEPAAAAGSAFPMYRTSLKMHATAVMCAEL